MKNPYCQSKNDSSAGRQGSRIPLENGWAQKSSDIIMLLFWYENIDGHLSPFIQISPNNGWARKYPLYPPSSEVPESTRHPFVNSRKGRKKTTTTKTTLTANCDFKNVGTMHKGHSVRILSNNQTIFTLFLSKKIIFSFTDLN